MGLEHCSVQAFDDPRTQADFQFEARPWFWWFDDVKETRPFYRCTDLINCSPFHWDAYASFRSWQRLCCLERRWPTISCLWITSHERSWLGRVLDRWHEWSRVTPRRSMLVSSRNQVKYREVRDCNLHNHCTTSHDIVNVRSFFRWTCCF